MRKALTHQFVAGRLIHKLVIAAAWLGTVSRLSLIAGQVVRPLGRTDCARFPRCDSAGPGNLPAAFRHSGKAWPAPAAGNRSARCPLRGPACRRAGIRGSFPEYYFGQIFEARHEPGTIAYSRELQLQLLQETTDEMARNGCKKVIIVNGHGGNENLLPYFAQSQLEKQHDYVVYVLAHVETPKGGPAAKSTGPDWHAGESETSAMLISHPNWFIRTAPKASPGATLAAKNCPTMSTPESGGMPAFPITTPGDGSLATREFGQFRMNAWIDGIVKATRAVKADQDSLRLQNEFFEKAAHPLDTRPQ